MRIVVIGGTDLVGSKVVQALAEQGHDAVALEQCDLLRGIAAVLRTDLVTLAPFPLARTSAVIAAKAWYVLTAGSKEERLRRFLNEELAALYGLPFPPNDEEARAERDARAADYVDLRSVRQRSNRRQQGC